MKSTAYAAILCSSLAIFASGCGNSTQSPTAPDLGSSTAAPAVPTPTPPAGGNATGSATITGTLSGATTSASALQPKAVTITITISGTQISTTASPGGTFVLNNVPSGNVELRFIASGIDARNTIGGVEDQEQIKIVVNVHGSTADVNVTDRQKPSNSVELEGLIASTNTSARTMVVTNPTKSMTVSVPANVVIRHGNTPFTFSELKAGQRVHVKGNMNGTTLVATEVFLQNENDDNDKNEAEVEGAVSALGGSCPSLTFTVKTTKVSTSASTQFVKGTCGQVANGKKVEVKGARQTDGSIKATRVELDKD